MISIPSSSSSSSSFLEISCCLPPGIEILSTKYGLGIFTTKFFKKNEVLYLGRYYNIKDTKEDQKIKLIIKKNKEKKEIEQEQREEQREEQEQEREEEEDNKEYLMTSEIHTVGIGYNDNKQRQVFTFDSFMNHSCDPNTFSADEHDDEYGGTYKTVALRDILPGEQITCDYDLFEYDSRNKGIEKCECGSSKCRGASLGFSFLPFNTQLELLNRAYPEVISAWLNDNPNILYREYTIPDGFALRKTNSGDLHLISTKEFSPNQLMHTYETEYFNSIKYDTVIIKIQTKLYNEDNQLIDSFSSTSSNKFTNNNNNLIIHENLDTGSNISLDEEESETIHEISSNISHEEINPLFPNNINNNLDNNNYNNLDNNNYNNLDNSNNNINSNNNDNNEFWHEPTYVIKNLDLITHTVNRDDNIRELFGWDTFCNHSCSPNSNFQYLTTTLTQTIALSKIKIGEMITCDYTLFDTELDGSEFICKCGSDNCKGIIKG